MVRWKPDTLTILTIILSVSTYENVTWKSIFNFLNLLHFLLHSFMSKSREEITSCFQSSKEMPYHANKLRKKQKPQQTLFDCKSSTKMYLPNTCFSLQQQQQQQQKETQTSYAELSSIFWKVSKMFTCTT